MYLRSEHAMHTSCVLDCILHTCRCLRSGDFACSSNVIHAGDSPEEAEEGAATEEPAAEEPAAEEPAAEEPAA